MQRLIFAVFILCVAVFPRPASAVPAFARKTGLSCTACHEAWPRLNEFGQQFRDNGYRLRQGKDAPEEQHPGYWPIAFRTTAGYQLLRQTLVPTDSGPQTTQTGTFGFTGLDILTAGTLGDKISFNVTYTPGLASAGFGLSPSNGNLESAWVGFHDLLGSTWLNTRIGKHAPDLPQDEHRTLTLTQGYNIYHFHAPGSASTFEPGSNQVGIEFYGHDALSRLRYSVSLVNENDAPASNNLISTPAVWAHVQGTKHFENDVLPAVKLGLFGAVGWHPTVSSTLTDSTNNVAPVQGTWSGGKPFRRFGAEAHLYFLNSLFPLTASGVFFYGTEDQGLIAAGTSDARFAGGWGELTYTPTINLVFLARYEKIQMLDQGTQGAFADLGNTSVFTAAVRYTIEVSNRAEVAAHFELSSATRVVDSSGNDPNTLTGLLAIDFIY